LLCPIILLLTGLIGYQNSFTGKFLFDDTTNVKTNYAMRKLWPLSESMWGPPGTGVAGRPVVQLSFAVNYAVHGLNVAGYHAGNLVIHLATTLLLFGVVRRTLHWPTLAATFQGRSTALAFVIALLWQLHPLLTDSVAYISGRTELLVAMFLLLTLYCFIRGTTSPRPLPWRIGTVLACILGTGCKEIMAVAPLMVLLYDRIFVSDSMRNIWRMRRWLYVALFASLVFIPLNLWMANFHRWALVSQDSLSSWDYLKTQAQVLTLYLRLSLWPHPLVIDYQGWSAHPPLRDVLPHGVVILLLLAVTAYGLIRLKPWAYTGAWFFLILAPTSSFLPLPTEIATERRMYLPLMAIVTLIVLALYQILARFRFRFEPAALGVVALLAAAEMVATRWRNDDYKDVLAMWADVAARRPNNSRAFTNIGAEYLETKDYPTAKKYFLHALAVNPNDFTALNNLGNQAMREGDDAQAESYFMAAIRAKPDYASPYSNLGLLQLRQARLGDAETNLRQAVKLQPNRVDHLVRLAKVLAMRGKTSEASQVMQRAATIDPSLSAVPR
jgi:tetratricopeptide (TPR) repeat protein